MNPLLLAITAPVVAHPFQFGVWRLNFTGFGIAVPHLHLHIYPVSAARDRSAVMQVIDAKLRDVPEESAWRALVEGLRSQLARLAV